MAGICDMADPGRIDELHDWLLRELQTWHAIDYGRAQRKEDRSGAIKEIEKLRKSLTQAAKDWNATGATARHQISLAYSQANKLTKTDLILGYYSGSENGGDNLNADIEAANRLRVAVESVYELQKSSGGRIGQPRINKAATRLAEKYRAFSGKEYTFDHIKYKWITPGAQFAALGLKAIFPGATDKNIGTAQRAAKRDAE